MSSELQQLARNIIEKALSDMNFLGRLAEGLSYCLEDKVWGDFFENSKGDDIELDFRVKFKDITKEGGNRSFVVAVNSMVDGKVINPDIVNYAMNMSERSPEVERVCDCNEPKLYSEDKIHCAYCGGVIHGE